jgi:hypothetical protein
MDSIHPQEPRNSPECLAEQRAARNAIERIPLFPDLTVMMRKALGYGPHCEMLQHFCYWFHWRHPKMRERWTLYKTRDEWREECGLSKRQVEAGRKTLVALGVVEYWYGPRKRPHYRVDWVRLAKLLELPSIGTPWRTDSEVEEDPLIGTPRRADVIGTPWRTGQLEHHGGPSITGDYTGDYFTGDTLLQSGAEPVYTETAPNKSNEKKPKESLEQPGSDQRHSQNRDTLAQEHLAKDGKNKVWAQILGYPKETELTRLADAYLAGQAILEQVAYKARKVVGGTEPIGAYMAWVERCLEDRRKEMGGAA